MDANARTSNQNKEIIAGFKYGKWVLQESLAGYKKIRCECPFYGKVDAIATLEIPKGANVVRPVSFDTYHSCSTISDKLRTDKVITKDISFDTHNPFRNWFMKFNCKCYSNHDSTFTYKVKETQSTELNTDVSEECVKGIHFVTDKQSAEDYIL